MCCVLLRELKLISVCLSFSQGRRRVLKSGTAFERHRRSPRAVGTSRGSAREGLSPPPPLVRGVWGVSPEKKFKFKMSVEAILMHFETMFACEIRLIVQAFHVDVFKRKAVRWISCKKFLKFKMSVEAILIYFESMFPCEIRLIVPGHFM